jgi:hypothetical protein
MILLGLLLMFTDTVVKVPPTHWTAIALQVDHNNSMVHASFDVRNGGRIQAVVLSRAQAERFNQGKTIKSLYSSGFETGAKFHVFVAEAGDYVLLLDNRLEGRFPAEVGLQFEITHQDDLRIQEVPAQTRRATVALSLLFFGAVVVFSAVKFLRT